MAYSRISMPFLTSLLVFFLAPMAEVIGFEGFGTATSGGNNGTVVEVTSLADSGTGTLRAALSSGTNLYIVFRVDGTINLQSYLELRGRSSITIDGSTAPGPNGITLQGYGLEIRNSHDIIVTHLRVRNAIDDGILVWDGSSNVVIDHCSVTNSGDENIGITEATSDVTVSWCIIGDTRPDWEIRKAKGMLITNFNKAAVTRVSLHHNLFTKQHQRSPEISTAGLFDLRNNVLKEWGVYGMRLRSGAWGNIINNVYASQKQPASAILLEAAGPVHIQGNQGPGSINVNTLSTRATPYAVAPVTTDPVTEVEQNVLQGVGAFPRDAIDASLAGSATPPSCAWANLARCATASASSVWSSTYSAAKANDGSGATRWNSASGDRVGAWLALDFGEPMTVDTIVLKEAINRITGYTVQHWDGAAWQNIVVGTTIGSSKTHAFAPLTTEWLRLVVTGMISGTASITPTLYEFEVYGE